MFRLNNKLFEIELFRIHHAVMTTIVIVVQRRFYRNCLWFTSRGIVVYIILDPALIFYLFPSWLSPLSPNLVNLWEGMKTTIDWDCDSQCLRRGLGLHCKPYFSMTFCGKEASVLLYMYVKYRIFTQNIYKIFVNFLRGILAFQKNDKSFARDLYQSNLSDKTRKTYTEINIILTLINSLPAK